MANRKLPKRAYDRVFELMAQGLSVKQACLEDDTPSETTFYKWLDDDEGGAKAERYSRAREARADYIFDEMIEIADDASNDYMERQNRDGSTTEVLDSEHVQRSTLRIRTRQWMLGRMAPSKYGDKLDVQHGGNVIVEIKK